jgi:hypothetical protein
MPRRPSDLKLEFFRSSVKMSETISTPLRIGFVILSYNEPDQLLCLTKMLGKMFNNSPIVCHHNFDQCDPRPELFPSNVQFVRPHIRTRWGHITTPLAAMRAFSQLRNEYAPDWYFLLSGSDYPVKSAKDILTELAGTRYDAYLDHREISFGTCPPNQIARDGGFGRKTWISLAYDRYCACRFWWPRISAERLHSGRLPVRREWVFIRDPDILRLLQRDRPERIFGGRFWFHANHKAICQLLDNASPKTLRYYRRRPIPEESLFHTILCNQSDLRICSDSRRYEDWTGGDAHPKWLTVSDLPKILASGAHFARKFRPDGVVQRAVNEALRVSM